MKPWRWILWALPRSARDDVVADLLEESAAMPARRGALWMAWQLLGVALAYHRADLLHLGTARALALALLGFVLLHLALPPAAQSLVASAVVLGPQWQSLIGTVWAAPSSVAAVTAGLVIGMLPQPKGAVGEAWRWLAVAGGACVATSAQVLADWALPGWRHSGETAVSAAYWLLLLLALVIGTRHRRHLEPSHG